MGAMLTTVDNPYDPRVDYPAWYTWDVARGYHTSSYLARVVNGADEFPEILNEFLIERAIDEIISIHEGEIYKKLMIE